MPVKILMPALSPTMKSGTVAHWHKREGDALEPGDIIADIETDKAVIEFEYVDEPGTLYKIVENTGAKDVPVNKVIALVKVSGDEDSDLQEMVLAVTNSLENPGALDLPGDVSKQVETPPLKEGGDRIRDSVPTLASDIPDSTCSSERIKASPLAKKIASQLSVDIRKVVGTGPYGRIVKADVLAAAESLPQSEPRGVVSDQKNVHYVDVSNMRRVVSERLVGAKRNIPHFYLAVDCVVEELLEVRARINDCSDETTKITVNDFAIRAAALALREFPEVNASWGEDKILCYQSVDVAFAVSIDGGLITPVIKGTDKLSLSEISRTAKSLAARAKERKLLPHEFQGGGITISNLGMFGIKEFYAIVNPPQSCIIAIGKSEKRPIVVNDNIVAANVMSVTLSVDHRIIDGVVAAKFLSRFKFYIENPLLMLAE